MEVDDGGADSVEWLDLEVTKQQLARELSCGEFVTLRHSSQIRLSHVTQTSGSACLFVSGGLSQLTHSTMKEKVTDYQNQHDILIG